MNGLVIVDKPIGVTSFDVIRNIRKEYNIKKVGHIGTLDPMATGVLPVLIGEATKLSDYLMEHDKEYIAVLKLGEKRDTGDSEGSIIEEDNLSNCILSKDNILKNLKYFEGESMQIPPMYSAIKVNGKKLYELARKGETIQRTPRKIHISNIMLNKIDNENNEIEYGVTCSKGTYIRVLCEDIAKKLNTVGYMKSLRRIKVGNFKISEAGKFIEMEKILDSNKKIEIIHDDDIKKLLNGVSINIANANDLYNLYYNNKYLGIGEVKNQILRRKIII